MQVNTTPTVASRVSVTRHVKQTPGQTHASSSVVYYGPAQAFVGGYPGRVFYAGSCTAANTGYQPLIDVINGLLGVCNASSQWMWTQIAPMAAVSVNYTAVNDAAYTAKITDYIIAYTALSAARTVTLPAATGLPGKIVIIRNESSIASNTIWVASASNIDTIATGKGIYGTGTAAASGTNGGLAAVGVGRFYSNGTAWFSF